MARIKLLVFAILVLNVPSLAISQESLYVLPDKQFIEIECNALEKDARNHLPASQDDIHDLCSRVRAGTINTDEWMIKIDPIAREVDGSIPCPNCLRLFLPKREPVPAGFKTYTLVLIPSPSLANNSSWLLSLKKQFNAFGSSIGEDKAAIWLGTRYGRGVDVERSKYYCDLFKLNYNDGPYFVTTNKRPDLFSSGDEAIIVKLNNISSDRVLRVLNLLEQDLRQEKEIRKRALLFEEVKQRLLSIVERYGDTVESVVVSWLKK